MTSVFSRPGFAPLFIRDFALFLCSRFLASLAIQMINVGVGWLVYDMTDSALALGFVGLAIFMPNLAFILVAGHVADRYERRKVLIGCYALLAIATSGLMWGLVYDLLTPMRIYALMALIGTGRAFAAPSSAAMVPNLVPRNIFANAVALNSSANQTATIVGPALGGLVYLAGAHVVFLTTTMLFVACTACLILIKPRAGAALHNKATWETLTAGFRYIRSNPILLGSISLDLFAVLLGGATALLPIFVKDIYGAGPAALGMLRSAPAVGAVCTAIFLAYTSLNRRVGLRMFQAVGAFGVATIGFGLSTDIYVALGFLTCLGAADMLSIYIRSTLVQIETPDEMRGRVSAVNSVFIGASNELGEFESGVLAHFIGPVAAVVVGGVGTIGITAGWMKLFPDLRQRDHLVPPQPAA